jgi:probable F420-dependent oxidoreductase
MDLGFFSYNVEYGARPDELAAAVEERGFESFWVGEHTHIPTSRKTPYPGGGSLPKPYYHMADPFVSLMAAAAATKRIKLGTGIALIPQHDPITLAKTVATLDYLSGGRVVLGVGAGWNQDECENHGVPYSRRWKALRERCEAMKVIWREEEASYAGEFANFESIISNPKPTQAGGPPILIGGARPKTLDRVARYADGWIPIDVLIDDLPAMMRSLREKFDAAGRDPADLTISVFAFNAKNDDLIRRYAEIGVDRTAMITPRRMDDALRWLDQKQALIAEVA